ncbi:hypothetical protein YQE_04930, partial [Dendroctonus ponderosae]
MFGCFTVHTPSPPPRPWIPLARPSSNRPACIFTVMCYNVLCDKYATRQMYTYCPSWALNWDYRKKGIMDEIQHYAADIINLQEVEMEQFYNFFMPQLTAHGYYGIYSPKSRAKHMAESERKFVDGCAIFFRTSKFTLVKEHLVEFNQLAMANADGLEHMLNRVMPKDNIGLAALLQTTANAWENASPDAPFACQPVLVCTAHLHWDPEYCDVKLIQTMMLSNELKSILEESVQTLRANNVNITDPSNIQLVLCGDFNSLPESGVIEFLGTGKVSQDHQDFKAFSYKAYLEKVLSCDKPNEFTHFFKLASAYNDEIMPFTNYTFDFKGIIDYIFYAKNTMTPLGLLGPISQDWISQNKVIGCPHPHVYSDHFPLLVELEMVPTIFGPMNGIIRYTVHTPSPPPRPWIPLARPSSNRPACIFTVMCYNVLCDKYATRQMYTYCPSWALNWDYRKKGIMDEIQHYAADIINLQEVEMEQFYNFFMPQLKAHGYYGIYSPKSRAKHMAESERKFVDAPPDAPFACQPVLVCTAHLHWDPEYCDVKLIQTMMLSNELKSILEESVQTLRANNVNITDPSNIQLVLCGDFNSLPDSGVIEFLGTGKVSQDHQDFKAFSYKACLEKVLSCDKPNEFTHSFKLASAYNDEIMPFTNYTFDFKGIIDYIFYAKNTMTPLGLLGPISQDWISQNKVIGCPHPHVYSDHFPLLVELEMVPTISGPMNGIIRYTGNSLCLGLLGKCLL